MADRRTGGVAAIGLALALLVGGWAAAPVRAEEGGFADTLGTGQEWQGNVGLGAGILPDYSGASDYRVLPALRASVRKGGYSASLLGLGAKADIFAPRNIAIGPVATFQFGRDDNKIPGLPGYDDAVYFGGHAGIAFDGVLSPRDRVSFEAIFLQNVTRTGDGYQYGATAGYGRPLSRTVYANLTVGIDFSSKDMMQVEYGVSPAAAAASGLPAYSPSGGLEGASATLLLGWRFAPDWGLFGVGGYKRLLGDAGDSPIVQRGSEDQFFSALGLSYFF